METRLIIAYALIALMVGAALATVAYLTRNRRAFFRTRRARRKARKNAG